MLNHYRTNDYRAPRTMNEAFGPYARLDSEPRDKEHPAWLVACVLVAVAIGAMFAAEV